jgi:hypothetical protein
MKELKRKYMYNSSLQEGSLYLMTIVAQLSECFLKRPQRRYLKNSIFFLGALLLQRCTTKKNDANLQTGSLAREELCPSLASSDESPTEWALWVSFVQKSYSFR